MGYELKFPDTAFSVDRRDRKSRKPRDKDAAHLAWVATLPSLVPGTGRVDPAHIRYADPRYAKRSTGKGEKPDDKWVVPLCRTEHDRQHSMREQAYWQSIGIDPCHVALLLWANSGDDEEGEHIISKFRSRGADR